MTILSSVAARRASAAGLALTACLTAAPAAFASAGTAPMAQPAAAPSEAGLDRYYQQRLDWRSCIKGPDDTTGRDLEKAGAQCADVTVPLDYADPRGRTITVAISRLKATDTRRRVGPLLINFGGPGGPALGDPPEMRKAMKDVGARYDIIGMDPRSVGRSTPLDCNWPVGHSIYSAGADRESFDRQVALHKDLAAKCRAANASLLPHISTRNTARDMDVIRGALGERKISYLGYSYGTYLGTVYTQLFPGRYDRMVLDGAIDPRRYNPRLLRGVEKENEQALADWAAWAAKRHDAYGLGRTRAQVLATVDRVVNASARGLTVGTGSDSFRLDATQVPTLIFGALSSDTDSARAEFGDQVSTMAKAADNRPAPLSPEFKKTLQEMLTSKNSQYGSAQTAILCGDGAAPRDPEVYWRDIERSRAAHPLFGPLTNNIGPCAFWDRPREEPTRVQHDAAALIVAATGDTRTDYEGGRALHGMLPGSKLITVKGANQHGVYLEYGNACVDREVNAYLATGELPAGDRTCAKTSG
ncbi:alpha/beta hydrolase [Streptomyces telluris]|uniref:Alpha/beta hydrolase n=1 Tax=Streptomyces telluris TaxID=2720021 RepID=A0A9X2RM62_9ACTN|nr:alpha/beta hydrolase [Streptomyces telluris]MCQ8771597.1 alpha/beta hydrolase [Streptomyces telluris]NJP77791.1 alpha/beta hydrolase [Streptomyces telluris]